MSDWQRVKAVFEDLVDLPATERSVALERAAGGDVGLRASVEALLSAHERAGVFLDAPTLDAAAGRSPAPETGAAIGRIGPYEPLEVIGEGGFGTVYRARQDEPVRRVVALKVIKPGMDTREVIARFDGERQALALMDHPNIARVLDAGATGTGRPYFVMELVDGAPITEYCQARRCDLRRRLELMVRVCHAVQHAHQKGVIHRDLKPSNVLVTEHDGIATPKVIDFGIAKALHGSAVAGAPVTRADSPIGTPAYMSPEQADGVGSDIDTRADIYSLGVLLYELLTGVPPFDPRTLAGRSYAEVRRIIREVEPLRPSARLAALIGRRTGKRAVPVRDADTATASDGAAERSPIQTAAPQRAADSESWARTLGGDLDWIVMKCLEKDRTRRYASASELALELGRHLNDEPVSARPPTLRYRLTKFARRHRGTFVTITAIALALTLGLGASVAGFVAAVAARNTADEQRRLAEANADLAGRAARRAEAVNTFLQEMLSAADPNLGATHDLTVRESLDRALARLNAGALTDQPDVAAAVRLTIGRTYAGLAQFAAAEREIQASLTAYERLWGGNSLEFAEALQQRGVVRKLTARPAEAEPDMRRALDIVRARRAPHDPIVATYLNDLALALSDLHRAADAERLLREALAIARLPQNANRSILGEVLNNLGALRLAQSDWSAAEPWFREALEANRRLLGNLHPSVATILDNLAQARVGLEDMDGALAAYQEALAIRRRLFAAAHPDVATTLHNLAVLRYRLKQFAECEAALRESLAIFRDVYGWPHLDTLTVLDSLVSVVGMSPSRLNEAEALLRQAFDAVRDAQALPAARRAQLAARLADLYRAWGKPDQAAEWQSVAENLPGAASRPGAAGP